MTKTQKYRHQLAQIGIECTLGEVRKLVKVAKRIKEMTNFPTDELMEIFDLKDEKQRMIFDVVMKFKYK